MIACKTPRDYLAIDHYIRSTDDNEKHVGCEFTLLDKYGWGTWTYMIMPFSFVGGCLMLTLWNATPKNTKVSIAPGGSKRLKADPEAETVAA